VDSPFSFFVRNWSYSGGPTASLINNGGHLASALHLEIDGASMVRKRVIDEPQNLNHNVVPKRAEIGQITRNNARGQCYPDLLKLPETDPQGKGERAHVDASAILEMKGTSGNILLETYLNGYPYGIRHRNNSLDL
jgi:hypothetical protein